MFQNRLGVTHEMRVGIGRRRGPRLGWRGQRSGRHGPTADALPHEPNMLCGCLLSLCAVVFGR
jgi:hypothetical protein